MSSAPMLSLCELEHKWLEICVFEQSKVMQLEHGLAIVSAHTLVLKFGLTTDYVSEFIELMCFKGFAKRIANDFFQVSELAINYYFDEIVENKFECGICHESFNLKDHMYTEELCYDCKELEEFLYIK